MILQTKYDHSESHLRAEVRDNGLILIRIRHTEPDAGPGKYTDSLEIGFSPAGTQSNRLRQESTRADLRRWAIALVAAIDADPEVNNVALS